MIEYKTGDLFELMPKDSKQPVFIPHIVNTERAWGSGFVVPCGRYFPASREAYLNHAGSFVLGEVQIVRCYPVPPWSLQWPENANDSGPANSVVYVCNMVAQTAPGGPKPIKYAALAKCMERIEKALRAGGVIHAPQFGALRAGGNWEFIEELINEIWGDFPVTVYKYEEK